MKERIFNNWKTSALGIILLVITIILLFIKIITLGEFSVFFPTNRGVTLSTWQKVGYDKDGDSDIDIDDIRLLTPDDALMVLKKFYWDRWHADEINNQKVANILVDWLWCSGKWGILIPQRILGVPVDGIVGPITIQAVNRSNPYRFLIQIYNTRSPLFLTSSKRILPRSDSKKAGSTGSMLFYKPVHKSKIVLLRHYVPRNMNRYSIFKYPNYETNPSTPDILYLSLRLLPYPPPQPPPGASSRTEDPGHHPNQRHPDYASIRS